MKRANILGVSYKIEIADEAKYPELARCDGFCDHSIKLIVVKKFRPCEGSLQDLEGYTNQVIRHELIHAFLYESGLRGNSDWAASEEMVDWVAIQIPRMSKLFQQLDIM